MKIMASGMIQKLAVFAMAKFLTDFFRNLNSSAEKIRAGQKASFRCSQVLSFTAAMSASGLSFPESSKAKCRNEPKNIIKIVPAMVQTSTFLSEIPFIEKRPKLCFRS